MRNKKITACKEMKYNPKQISLKIGIPEKDVKEIATSMNLKQ